MANKGKILVVDDDRLVLATVAHGLAQAGYEVIDADNGDDAILLARQHRPDLALLDIRMEGKSGFDVAEYLRDVGHTPFMFLSAFSDDDTAAKVQALGALAYLVKPLEVSQIVPTVDAAFERARALQTSSAITATAASSAATATTASSATAATTGAASPAGREAAAVPADGAAAQALVHTVPIALGVLMHRFSLSRADALARLRRTAAADGRTLAAQAERVVQAVEDLAERD